MILMSCGYEKNPGIELFEDQACLAMMEPLAKDFTFLMCSCFLVSKHLPVSPT